MSTVSQQIREEKKGKKEPYNPKKEKFKKEYQDYTDSEILKEALYVQQLTYYSQKRSATDVNVIKWIVLISFIASIIVGVIIGLN